MIHNFWIQKLENHFLFDDAAAKSFGCLNVEYEDMLKLNAARFEELQSMYCLWIEQNYWLNQHPEQHATILNFKPKKAILGSRVARVKSLNFDVSLQKLIRALENITMSNDLIVSRKYKGQNRRNASSKRTSYIGVSKNGPNWQALITINKKKTYIGTFMTEEQWARAFDFYSLLLNSFNAVTNFNYTKDDVFELIQNFRYLIE